MVLGNQKYSPEFKDKVVRQIVDQTELAQLSDDQSK